MASVISKYSLNDSRVYSTTACVPDKAYFDRVETLVERHRSLFGSDKELRFFSSPGRIEICGNHTDHQNGKVLCGAVNLDTLAVGQKSDDDKILLSSDGYPLIKVDLNDLCLKAPEYGTSTALVKGVCKYFVDNGKKVGGFRATATSNVFKGAGISSSASFELLIATILNCLFNGGEIDNIFTSSAAHYAESVYFGKPCGMLDQCAIAFGGICYIDFATGEPVATSLNVSLPLSVVLVNTEGDHSALTDQYAKIRTEMNAVANYFGKKVLREVDEKEFTAKMPYLRKSVNGRAILRSIHFFNEEKRVDDAKRSVETNDFDAFCQIVNQSGESSLAYLQNCYPAGDETQAIPSAVAVLKDIDGVKAARVHGGGFAGTVIAFVETNKLDSIQSILNDVFGKENYYVVNVRPTGACEITKEISEDEKRFM